MKNDGEPDYLTDNANVTIGVIHIFLQQERGPTSSYCTFYCFGVEIGATWNHSYSWGKYTLPILSRDLANTKIGNLWGATQEDGSSGCLSVKSEPIRGFKLYYFRP